MKKPTPGFLVITACLFAATNTVTAEIKQIKPACLSLLQSSNMIAQRLVKSRKCIILKQDKSRIRCTYSVDQTQLSYEFNKTTHKVRNKDPYNSIVRIHKLDPKMKVVSTSLKNNSIGFTVSWNKSSQSQCTADSAKIYRDTVSWTILLYYGRYRHLLSTPKPHYLNEDKQ